MNRTYYKLIDTISGEILECSYRNVILEEGHDRMKNYNEIYNKEFYLVSINTTTYELREYFGEEKIKK